MRGGELSDSEGGRWLATGHDWMKGRLFSPPLGEGWRRREMPRGGCFHRAAFGDAEYFDIFIVARRASVWLTSAGFRVDSLELWWSRATVRSES